ncbi:MAG TPA: hypothetical protein PLO41_07540 [Rubrivivax sp.]|nr:hypothetical protein [Rubrivivax sp.]
MQPLYGPCKRLDFEFEWASLSARAAAGWEMLPLGPSLGKNLADGNQVLARSAVGSGYRPARQLFARASTGTTCRTRRCRCAGVRGEWPCTTRSGSNGWTQDGQAADFRAGRAMRRVHTHARCMMLATTMIERSEGEWAVAS